MITERIPPCPRGILGVHHWQDSRQMDRLVRYCDTCGYVINPATRPCVYCGSPFEEGDRRNDTPTGPMHNECVLEHEAETNPYGLQDMNDTDTYASWPRFGQDWR